MKKAHIVYLVTKLELGGAQKVCLALLNGLHQEDPSSCSLISGSDGALVDQVKQFKSVFLIKELQREVGSGIKKIYQEFKAFFSIIKILKKLNRDYPNLIVHTHSTKAGIMGRWAAYFARVPIRIHTVHGYGFHDHQSRLAWLAVYLLEYLTSFITTHFVCVSEQDRDTGIRLFPKFFQKSSVIRAAVQDENFYPAQVNITNNQQDIIIGTVSCFKPQKNLFDLLKAFHYLYQETPVSIQKRLRLQIIGDGVLRNELETWIIHHKLQTHIDLLGWQNNVADWMRTWNIFTLSSLWEGLPCAIIEARLCKLPVVAYDVGGIREVIKNGYNGFLIQPGDWKKLAEKFSQLICSQELYESMYNNSDTLDSFKNNTMIGSHKKLYDNFIAHQPITS
ncbi:glycosyltransferase family 4 protein [Candidatus Dependentiae bacterium]|jgi:glycosyltransferase involved in cell wall biosynthesis|nr:glycosyltransferase family 4 protein [Candidatus Dependentiae bacterium]